MYYILLSSTEYLAAKRTADVIPNPFIGCN